MNSNTFDHALDTQALGMVPMVIETSGRDERAYDIYSRLLKERVVVYGKLNSNSAGLPISIMADEFEAVPKRHLPTIEEMSGLVEDFTEGMSLKEYMEILSNGWLCTLTRRNR